MSIRGLIFSLSKSKATSIQSTGSMSHIITRHLGTEISVFNNIAIIIKDHNPKSGLATLQKELDLQKT